MQFLCIIPKHGRDQVPDPEVAKARVAKVVDAVGRTYRPYLGAAYGKPQILKSSANSTAYVAIWNRTNDTGTENYVSAGDRWVVSAGSHVAREIHESVVLAGGNLRYQRPVWGSYAVVVGDKYMDRVTAWCTSPALEAIHYGESSNYVFVSNRPLAVALARAYGVADDIRLSEAYLAEYLAYGYSVSGQTPFEGVRTAPADAALSVVQGRPVITSIPSGLTSPLAPDHTLEEGAEALAGSLINAMDRTEREIKGTQLQLRLSGGKDSRLLMGLLRERSLDVSAVTYGVKADGDVIYASKLAAMAQIQHWIGAPEPATGVGTEQQTLRTIFECGGIPPSEPHLATSSGANPKSPNDAIMLGQWPLFKGGIAKVVRYPLGGIDRTLVKQIAPFIDEELRTKFEKHLRNWAEEVHASSELERLYLFAREFRSGRYLHSHIAHYSRDAVVAYPISDAEVTAVCDDLSMYEKVSQKSLFLALRKIWPEALALPLHNSTWRFEASGPADISGPDFGARQIDEDLLDDIKESLPVDGSAPNAYSSEMVNALCSQIVKSVGWSRISELLSNPMKEAILLSSQSRKGWQYSTAGIDYIPKEFAKYVWRIFVADMWWSRRWIVA